MREETKRKKERGGQEKGKRREKEVRLVIDARKEEGENERMRGINYGKIKKRTNFERAKTYEDLDQFA